jgi:hypothetical protein
MALNTVPLLSHLFPRRVSTASHNMLFLYFDLETFLYILRIGLLIRWITFVGMFIRIGRERQDSCNRLISFLRKVFLPLVQEREAAQNPQGGNNNGPPTPLSVHLEHSIGW